MSGLRLLTLSLMIVINIGSAEYAPGLHFVESPMNVTSSLGKPVVLQCTLRAESIDQGPLDVLWLRNGKPLEFGDTNQMQVPDDDKNWLVISKLRIDEVQLSDMGAYQCAAYSVEEDLLSIEGHIQLEGLPYFSVEPQHMSEVANVRISLQCTAHGPPEPVRVIWLQDGAPLNKLDDPISLSPSTFTISGLNKTTSFSCEAHNRKGVASSGTGVVTVRPAQPHDIKAEEITNSSIHLSWKTGFGGIYPINLCTVQFYKGRNGGRPTPGARENQQWLELGAGEITAAMVLEPESEESTRKGKDNPGGCSKEAGDGHKVRNTIVKSSDEDSDEMIYDVSSPKTTHLFSDLQPFSQYDFRVACQSSQGDSDWTVWETISTNEGATSDSLTTEKQDDFTPMEKAVSWQSQYSYSDESSGLHAAGSSAVFSLQKKIKMAFAKLNLDLPSPALGPSNLLPHQLFSLVPDSTPENVTAVVNGTEVQLRWFEPSGKINGQLQGYMMEYISPNMEQVVVDTGLNNELFLNLSAPLSNISFRVCAYTTVGQGPWTPLQTIMLIPPEMPLHSRDLSSSTAFSWHWWYVVMAIAAAIALAVLLAMYVTKLRRKETRFGEAFEPMMESGELVVRYRARRTYSRRTTEATLNTLGISDELKQKLQDVMVDRHKLMLGKTLGEGEFGSVMEGLLTQEDSVLKVAVKTMKIAICTRTEMEDFLREAACMKEFDHHNVMRLLGVCLQTVESEGYPSPVVILPYMKHGDLHSYLLYSRLGDSPVFLPSQMLVKFMTDIARGMEYLSGKNFIHRDLAARNCMLNENMNVCVADFGLSKKIYNGDYYRQGRISKMPVKWIAIESLADRVYTTKSDVTTQGGQQWRAENLHSQRSHRPQVAYEKRQIHLHSNQFQ
ncbi:Tyrosine-protein kinase receptor UFO [Triplophysa tibetana]|uniref:receptor protein-tyrosine kinase n=1 Tax=Triplophysa tibetana TaxID=1572043 RepID=A0A5A9MXD9_9TELE|nr:Tyrosine-protein kinase receptor UFO [Triplophysa tibetana]